VCLNIKEISSVRPAFAVMRFRALRWMLCGLGTGVMGGKDGQRRMRGLMMKEAVDRQSLERRGKVSFLC